MNRHLLAALAAVVLIAVAVAFSLFRAPAPQTVAEREAPAATAAKPLYWYDPMVPDQKFDKPGKSPFMDMQLVPKYADEAPVAEAKAEPPAATAAKPLYWYDPMFPDSKFDKPGKSPFMDMQLVPKYAEAPTGGGDGSFRIDPRVVQNLGVRVAKVERQSLSQIVQASGVVAVDEHRIESVQVRASGWVEQLAVRAVGDPVRRGALLAAVYSPELFAAQQEFLLAQSSSDEALKAAARSRLALFGLSEAQIKRVSSKGIAERRVEYFAPADGYVTELGVRQGAMVAPGMTLFTLASVSSVWINAEVPETQASWIKLGDAAQASLPSLPGSTFSGKVEYVYPELSGGTRTARLRIAVENPAATLKPGMYASLRLAGAAREAALTVPTEAVIRTGLRSVVLIAEDLARFRPVAVKTGAEVGDRIEVLEGLSEGQEVVASGQFLIDSEASLRGALDRLAAPEADKPFSPREQGGDGGVSGPDAVDPHAGHEGHQP